VQAFLISTGVVALAEIGDKTQLLAFILAARFRRPWPIVLGILLATLFNHGLAGALGSWITAQLSPQSLRWLLGGAFLAMAAWVLIPDRFDEGEVASSRFGVFGTTLLTFFMAEMGDKTQIATVALAAQYQSLIAVVLGTTLGMMLANVPAVLLGEQASRNGCRSGWCMASRRRCSRRWVPPPCWASAAVSACDGFWRNRRAQYQLMIRGCCTTSATKSASSITPTASTSRRPTSPRACRSACSAWKVKRSWWARSSAAPGEPSTAA
jgi:putative Ca2+/H+ antiporter (TMEM165/GDT1 family)